MEDNNEEVPDDQALASKSWLRPASASLHQLDQVKAAVYNFGLGDHRDIKATSSSLKKRSNSHSDLEIAKTDDTLSGLLSQKTAWGSNSSIPELMKQFSQRQRPDSGQKHRPSSGKKNKLHGNTRDPSIPPAHPGEPSRVPIGVKGAKFDPEERLPKGYSPCVDDDFSRKHVERSLQEFMNSQVDITIHQSYGKQGQSLPPVPRTSPDLIQMTSTDTGSEMAQEEIPPLPPEPQRISLDLPSAQFDDRDPEDEIDTDRLLGSENGDNNVDDDLEVRSIASSASSYGIITVQKKKGFAYVHANVDLPSKILSRPLNDYMDVNKEQESEQNGGLEQSNEDVEMSRLLGEDIDAVVAANDLQTSSNSGDGSGSMQSQPVRRGVTFAEERNITVPITPRNPDQAHRPKSGKINLKNIKSRVDTGVKVDTDKLRHRVVENQAPSPAQDRDLEISGTSRPPRLIRDNVIFNRGKVSSKTVLRRPKSAGNQSNGERGADVPTAEVDYGDEEIEEKSQQGPNKITLLRKPRRKVTDTVISQMTLSDSENDLDDGLEGKGEGKVQGQEEIPRSWSPTKVVSSKVKNYYEIGRLSQSKDLFGAPTEDAVPRFKITKTLEFDRSGLIESKSVHLIEGQAQKPKDYVPPTLVDNGGRTSSLLHRPKTANVSRHLLQRPNSAIRRPASAVSSGNQLEEPTQGDPLQRPGSRIGHVPVAPDNEASLDSQGNAQEQLATPPKRLKPITAKRRELFCAKAKKESGQPSDSVKPLGVQPARKEPEVETLVSRVTSDASADVNDTESLGGGDTLDIGDTENSEPARSGSRLDNLISKELGNRITSLLHSSKLAVSRSRSPSGDDNAIKPASAMEEENLETDTDNCGSQETTSAHGNHHGELEQTSNAPQQDQFGSVDRRHSKSSKPPVNRPTTARHGTHCKDRESKPRPFSAATETHRPHHKTHLRARSHSAGHTRKKHEEKPAKVIEISTRRDIVEVETEKTREVRAMSAKLREKGVNISEDTLKRALLPPCEESLYIGTKVHLPKSCSLGLLNSPSVWLSKEFKRLKLAEKAVERANERIWEQKQEEKKAARKALLAETGGHLNDATKKKRKKSGKKAPHKRSSTMS
ncbi:uncharacterized protein LOC106180519 [Lingula anatina]|uniref:Uncharacterized protein LOC106180519 n=1 Tax=Lingula anatina TaxID=7574 RepID=A0A1S3KBG9_LINAN|nr:uncharacterized protein LOC106180519 [Lingula anatina]|eukprot:XP_013419983.1 uncharacterized protein LOC106180519 [Lingula anatina]